MNKLTLLFVLERYYTDVTDDMHAALIVKITGTACPIKIRERRGETMDDWLSGNAGWRTWHHDVITGAVREGIGQGFERRCGEVVGGRRLMVQ